MVELLLSWSAQKCFGLDIVNGLVVAFKDAIRKRNRDVELFLEWGAHIEVLQTELDYGIFELVLESPVLEIIKLFRIYGFDPEKGYGNPPRTPLQAAVIRRPNDPVGVARCLLDLGVDIEGCSEQERRTPLQIATDNRDYEMVELLVKFGADIGRRYTDSAHTPIGKVIKYGHLVLLKCLLPLGSHMEKEYFSPRRTLLQIVVEMQPLSSVDMVGFLLATGAKVGGRTDQDPRTPLQIAVQINDSTMAQFLTAHGANIEECSVGSL